MKLKINETREKGIRVLALEGNLDAESAPALDGRISEAMNGGDAKLVLAMSGLELISSAGWSIFIESAVQCKEKGGDIRLAGMNPDAAKIFRIMGIDKLIKSYGTKEEAVKSF
jgi:anti-sigma B factor antagonist